MRILKLLRSSYDGDEYLVEQGGMYKRSKGLSREAYGTSKEKITERLNSISKARAKFIFPDYIDLEQVPPIFNSPYHEESDIRNTVLEDGHRLQIARSLLEYFETFQHSSSEGFGVWGIPELLISDKLYLLPPLWVNLQISALKLLLNRTDVIVAPELLKGQLPTPASDVYVIGKILQELLPESVLNENQNFIQQMIHPNPSARPTHYSRILNQHQYSVTLNPLSSTVKREFISPHIIERDEELRQFLYLVENRTKNKVHLFLIKGSTRVGKSTFLSLIQNELRNQGWKTILATTPQFFLQELVQLTENPENIGLEKEDFQYLWDLKESFNTDRVLAITGKLLSTMDKLAILVDDLDLIEERFLKLLKNIQNMMIEKNIIIAATLVQEKDSIHFDQLIRLEPFSCSQSEKLLELLLGVSFIRKHKEKVNWIYKITGGYPGYIFNLLNLLNNSGKLVIENGIWNIAQDMTSLSGFGDYVISVFTNLPAEEKELISKIACLSEKFTYEELEWLCEFIQKPVETMQEFFLRLQESGLIFPEASTFRFSLKEVWETSYRLCPEEVRLALHEYLARKGTQLSKKAWHYKAIGKTRLAAKVYLSASRKAFQNNEGFDLSREYLEEAFHLLKAEEITLPMKSWHAFLNLFDGKMISDEIAGCLKQKNTYTHYYLENLFLKEEYATINEYCQQLFGREALSSAPHALWVYRILLQWAITKVKTGELDSALTLLNFISERIKDCNTYYYELLRVNVYNYIAQAYQRKNHWQTAYTISEANITRAKKHKLNFLLPDVYLTAGSILFIYGPNYAQPVFESAIQVSKMYFSVKKTLQPTLEMAHGFLYNGDIPKMFEYLEKAREIAQIFNEKDLLARSYVIEGLYHVYNKQWDEAVEDYSCAKEISSNRTISGMVARLSAMLFLLKKDYDNLDTLLKDNTDPMMEYGFEDVIAIYRAKSPEEIRAAFESFVKNNQLWIEEVALAFVDPLTNYVAEEYEQYLESSSLLLLRTHQKLSLAIVYEAMAFFYQKVGMVKKSVKFAREAYDLYKQTGMSNACKIVQQYFYNTEDSFEEIFRLMSTSIHAEVINQDHTVKVFDRLEKSLVKLTNEIAVLRQIINFSKILTASSDPKEVLDQFANWIASIIPVNRAVIIILSNHLILYRSSIILDSSDEEELIQEVVEKKPQSCPAPFEIKSEFYIDDSKKAILYISNQNLRVSTEDFEKMVNFLEYLEPIMGMAVGNSISYKSSILDPLTRLHTRWFFNQRLDEEMDKAQRLDAPLSVMMGDIDHFKVFNDSYGHKTGDEILVAIAQTMRNNSRKYDILGRYGGEEFILILPNTTGEEAFMMAERIRKAVAEIKRFQSPVTISFGVASTDRTHYEKAQILVSDADKALYHSKNNGRNKTTKFWMIGDE